LAQEQNTGLASLIRNFINQISSQTEHEAKYCRYKLDATNLQETRQISSAITYCNSLLVNFIPQSEYPAIMKGASMLTQTSPRFAPKNQTSDLDALIKERPGAAATPQAA
jgi:hypothetical protein